MLNFSMELVHDRNSTTRWSLGYGVSTGENLHHATINLEHYYEARSSPNSPSLIERSVERELVPMAKALNLGLTAWSPLAKGILNGKYHGHGSPGDSRLNNDPMRAYNGLMPE